ncbi:MAG: hypothetical protein H6R07_2995 [Proteobacteria bacterium]|nr:hypothetical protein [Pseudomonadota bacterium]
MNTLFIRALLVSSLLAPLAQAADESVASAPAASAPATASAPAAVAPSKADVTKAIAVLESNFLGQDASAAAQTVMQFAQLSKDIAIQLSPKTTLWIFGEAKPDSQDEEIYRQMLMVAYVAGNLKAQLSAAKPVDSPLAGWKFTLKAYQDIQAANSKIKIAELETLKKQQAKGELPKLAAKALQK